MITPTEFAEGCQCLVPVWERWAPDKPLWDWVKATGPFSSSLGGGYLAMQMAPVFTRPAEGAEDGYGSIDVGSLEEEDPAANPGPERSACGLAGGVGSRQLHLYNHYIVYSTSFGVPVWYFEGHDPGGSPLGPAQVLADLALASGDSSELISVVSQEEHPCLRRPCFMLHPCQTDAIMSTLTSNVAAARISSMHSTLSAESRQHPQEQPPGVDPLLYIMAWLSIAGKLFNLQLPLEAWAEYWRTAR